MKNFYCSCKLTRVRRTRRRSDISTVPTGVAVDSATEFQKNLYFPGQDLQTHYTYRMRQEAW